MTLLTIIGASALVIVASVAVLAVLMMVSAWMEKRAFEKRVEFYKANAKGAAPSLPGDEP